LRFKSLRDSRQIEFKAALLGETMSDGNIFRLPQPDQLRSDLAAIQTDLEFVASRVARLPTRGQLAQAALGIIFYTAIVTTLSVWAVWH
jgi:hypothetical protein